ncbi:replication initiator protein A [Frigidibacter sp. MR17.24]|uniref:replication initiator protein A n=1 Tax=Frigidibacter sp. MR17.24 TaxID=3127345 RepID=UPI003012DAA1
MLPEHHPGPDFFLCDILDALPKDDLASMEHPIFSLATRPDRRILRYAHNGAEIEVVPSVKGLATLFDKDILIYCVSQLMAAVNAGRPTARRLQLTAHDLMAATNRETSGDGYKRLREAFERLAGTRITTNITTGAVEATTGFGLIEGWRILRHAKGGRMISVEVTLSDWLYRAVMSKSVLTLSRDYFRLRKPLERRIYELARKHCGRQPEWRISVEVLAKKTGSASPVRVFRKMLRDMIATDHLPDYHLAEDPGDILRVTRRDAVVDEDGMVAASGFGGGAWAAGPVISEAARDRLRRLAPGYDVHALEAEWRGVWERSGRARLKSPEAALLGWAKKRLARPEE